MPRRPKQSAGLHAKETTTLWKRAREGSFRRSEDEIGGSVWKTGREGLGFHVRQETPRLRNTSVCDLLVRERYAGALAFLKGTKVALVKEGALNKVSVCRPFPFSSCLFAFFLFFSPRPRFRTNLRFLFGAAISPRPGCCT